MFSKRKKRANIKRTPAFWLVGGGLMLILLALLLFNGKLARTDAPDGAGVKSSPPKIGTALADFNLLSLAGNEKVSLSQYRGQPVMINFWGSWCPPCRQEMPLFQQVYARYGDQFVLIGINVQDEKTAALEYAEQTGITFPLVVDENAEVTAQFYVRGFPTSFFIDAEGVLQAMHVGVVSEAKLAGYLRLIGVDL